MKLTDDDVLKDVGVVVRRRCHLDTVEGETGTEARMIHNFGTA